MCRRTEPGLAGPKFCGCGVQLFAWIATEKIFGAVEASVYEALWLLAAAEKLSVGVPIESSRVGLPQGFVDHQRLLKQLRSLSNAAGLLLRVCGVHESEALQSRILQFLRKLRCGAIACKRFPDFL